MCAMCSDNALPEAEGVPGREPSATKGTLASPEALTRLCDDIRPPQGIDALVAGVNRLMPGLDFRVVISRSGWHRLGGVVDADYRRVSGNIVQWAEAECAGDVDELTTRYSEAGYFATRISGKTHFLTAPMGEAPEDFIQLEIEELQEQLDRPLVDPDWFPDSIEEFLEPVDYPRLEAEPIGPSYYQFRRITQVAGLLPRGRGVSRDIQNLKRFFRDWANSSAGERNTFSRHWVLALREYVDREGIPQLTAKPVAAFAGELPQLPGGTSLRGSGLAKAIHAYDRRLGYPFAWYFMMLSRSAKNATLAEAVLADQMGAYDYLPSRDLKVLREWEQRSYGV